MATKLERLLEDLDPRRVMEEVAARVDVAVNTFAAISARIVDWGSFKQCLIDFVAHVESKALNLPAPITPSCPDLAWGRCVRVLMSKYGSQGEKAAFEMARTGTQGGLYDVLNKVAWHISENLATNEIQARINTFWHGLSAAERHDAADEYLARYGHLLPSETT